MLTSVPSWRAGDARVWAGAAWHPWARAVVIAGCVASVAAAIIGDTHPCSAEDPAVCGPSTSFAVALVFLAASVVLLWWRPVLACLCAVVVAVLEVPHDESHSAPVAFAAYAMVALAVAAYIVVCRRRQRLLVDRVAQRSVQLPAGVQPVADHQVGVGEAALTAVEAAADAGPAGLVAHLASPALRALMAALLVAGSAGAGFWYAREVRGEQEHLARAVEVSGRVEGPANDDYIQRLRILDPVPGGPAHVELEPLDDLPEGSVQRLLVDPADPRWVRLVAEPADATGWLSLSVGLGLLASLLAWRAVETQGARRALSAGGQPGVRGRFVHSPAGECLLLPADEDVVVALFDTDPAPEPDASDLDAENGVVFGDLRERGWVAVVGPRGLILPRGPLRVERRPERFDVAELGPDRELSDVGTPVTAGDPAALNSLPVVVRAPRPQRLLGAAMVAGAPVAAGLFTWYVAEGPLDLVPPVLIGSALVGAGVNRLWSALHVATDGVVTDSGYRARTLSWGGVRAVRVDHDAVHLEWEDGDLEMVPFGDLEPRSERYRRTEELAQAIRFLVDQAPSGPPSAPRVAWRPGAFAAVGSGIVLAATAAARFLL